MAASSLEPVAAGTQIDEVARFCEAVISRHSKEWPISEHTLSEEFIEHFRVKTLLFLTFEEAARLCQDSLRIPVSLANLPSVLKGLNISYNHQHEIVISTNQGLAAMADLHTLLHELREIIERGFQKLGHSTTADGELDLEARAELFASAVQISAAYKEIPNWVESAAAIERKWLRVLAYLAVFGGATLYTFHCLSLPKIEDSFAAHTSAH